jgi:hypothetical protein
VIDWAIQAFGGAGVSDDFGLAYMYAGARTLRLADGPDEVIFREPILEEFVSERAIRREIERTVVHEIAHFFGSTRRRCAGSATSSRGGARIAHEFPRPSRGSTRLANSSIERMSRACGTSAL